MKYSDIKRLKREDIPQGEEGAKLAARIRQYILHKNKIIKSFMIAFSSLLCALAVFVAVGRGTDLYANFPAVFWTAVGILCAGITACATVVGINMYAFRKFLKKFD